MPILIRNSSQFSRLHGVGALAALLVAACGGGGGGSSVNTPAYTLNSKADAIREVANVAALLADLDPNQAGFAPGDAGPVTSATGPATQTDSSNPATTNNCRDGGSESDTDVATNHTFQYFTPVVQITNNDGLKSSFSGCTVKSGGSAYVYDGYAEEGQGTDDASDTYSYLRAGLENDPSSEYRIQFVSGTSETLRLRGLIERVDLGNQLVQKTQGLSYIFSEDVGQQKAQYQASLGSSGNDFTIQSPAPGTFTIDGPLSYSSSAASCLNASLLLKTATALVVDSHGVPNSGELDITAGSAKANVIFSASGAQAQFADGHSEMISSTELATAIGANPCRNVVN
jgi:hypothetical protein